MPSMVFKTAQHLCANGKYDEIARIVEENPDLLSIATPGHNRTLLWIATRKSGQYRQTIIETKCRR
jgi:hypothetical protein